MALMWLNWSVFTINAMLKLIYIYIYIYSTPGVILQPLVLTWEILHITLMPSKSRGYCLALY